MPAKSQKWALTMGFPLSGPLCLPHANSCSLSRDPRMNTGGGLRSSQPATWSLAPWTHRTAQQSPAGPRSLTPTHPATESRQEPKRRCFKPRRVELGIGGARCYGAHGTGVRLQASRGQGSGLLSGLTSDFMPTGTRRTRLIASRIFF